MARLAADLQRVFEDRFVALVAYGPTRTVGFARTLRADDLAALAPLADRWHREGLDTPLLLTPEEFSRSLDAFPLEYEAILDRHELIAGILPFGDVRPNDADLRRACEVQAQSFLIHLRQGWVHAADHHDDQIVLLQQSAAPLRALLSNVVRLTGTSRSPQDDDALVKAVEDRIGLPGSVLAGVLALDAAPDQAAHLLHAPEFMPAYLLAAETLWTYIDSWRR